MHEYKYSLWDGETRITSMDLSEICFWATRREEREFFEMFPQCESFRACVNSFRGTRIGSRKRLRGLMQAAGWQRNDINYVIGQLRERSRNGWSAQLLWYSILSRAMTNKAIQENFGIAGTSETTMNEEESAAFKDALRKG